ncbi:aldo/keto reductase [Puniceicoccus vermicola]|uniref:Aldo/keto reductase n=1 Tax=Puniceicoccus vermicola TaxID=388746 RepID=A0A7X1B0J4_9BACT|nr:aldo/keto reductase [Puniceicoccus vermicola]MBC2602308.1 aldo/keto reductase [Puniceicoccus vermicola]
MKSEPIRWGIIGPGNISRKFALGVEGTPTGQIVAAGSREKERAQSFLNEIGAPEARAYGDYRELLEDPAVDAVYIATPHPMHARWCIAAARAAKHILCEKPITLNLGEALAVVNAAEEANIFLMEAFMYRCHPQTRRVYDLVKEGTIGKIRRIQAEFSFAGNHSPESRLMNPHLGGGSILDVGCYPISFARMIAGAAHGEPFLNPKEIQGVGHLDGETGVDTWASALLQFPDDLVAEIFTGVRVQGKNECVITGTEGRITVKSPWFCNGETQIEKFSGEPETLAAITDRHLYAYEAELFAQHIGDRSLPAPAMTIADTLGNLETLDRWRSAIGMTYPMEEAGPDFPYILGHALPDRGSEIPTGSIPFLDKPVARLVMGTSGKSSFPRFAHLYDDYFERGGNAFDDGSIYRRWNQRLGTPGQWMKTRGVREQCVLLDKGAHHPKTRPELMMEELEQSLESQQTDYLDGYVMHRDNPAIPAGEFVTIINEMVTKGLVRTYGFSNWTVDRLEEAIQYAEQNGLQPPALLSNHLSLARLVNPIWEGCLAASDRRTKEWLAEKNFTLLPWASQANGFFTERSDVPASEAPKNLVAGYYSEDNFERKRRCYELAGQRNVHPINVSLAWVLSQPFPTFPAIGPMTPSETRTTLPALSLNLTPEEVAWLNLESE